MKKVYMFIILTSIMLGIFTGNMMQGINSDNTVYGNEEKYIESLEKKLSYTDVKGSGIVITIDAVNENVGNIANLIDYNRILVNIENELKSVGGEFISINDQRINQYSEIVLAGSHININGTPIAQPYVIKVIGDDKKLHNYMEQGSGFINKIQLENPIKVGLKMDKTINMKKINLPNHIKYIEGE